MDTTPTPRQSPRLPGFVIYEGYDRELALKSVGAGWASLINKVFDEVDGTSIRIVQVKEKFGGLRIYAHNHSDEFWKFLNAVEDESFAICEDCGQPGAPRTGGWIRTLCEAHADGRPVLQGPG